MHLLDFSYQLTSKAILLSFLALALNPFVVPCDALETPKLREAVPPTIPKLVLAARIKTEVIVRLEIADSGIVASAHATAGHPLLLKPTEDSALQWRFEASPETRRSLTLTFVYDYTARDLANSLKILPYGVELKTSLPVRPPNSVRRLPDSLREKRTRC